MKINNKYVLSLIIICAVFGIRVFANNNVNNNKDNNSDINEEHKKNNENIEKFLLLMLL